MNNQIKGEQHNSTTTNTTTDNKRNIQINSSLLFENRISREWLSTEDAAQYLSISANALRIMVHRDQINAYKFGRRLRFRAEDCVALIKKVGA